MRRWQTLLAALITATATIVAALIVVNHSTTSAPPNIVTTVTNNTRVLIATASTGGDTSIGTTSTAINEGNGGAVPGSASSYTTNVSGSYSGNLYNATHNTPARITSIIQQSQNSLSGSITIYPPLDPGVGPIPGSVSTDSQGHTIVRFTTTSIGQVDRRNLTLNFAEMLYQDGSLRGNYVVVQTGETGAWALGKQN